MRRSGLRLWWNGLCRVLTLEVDDGFAQSLGLGGETQSLVRGASRSGGLVDSRFRHRRRRTAEHSGSEEYR